MKRKLVQHGSSSLTVTLPNKWLKKYNLKKGDEVDVEESRDILSVFANKKESKPKEITIDLTGLDRTFIIFAIRSAYRSGFERIKLIFKSPTADYFRLKSKINVISVIHNEVNNKLIGLEIVEEGKDYCVIKDYSKDITEEFENAMRIIFRTIINTNEEILGYLDEKEYQRLSVVEERHDTATKFVNYCLRLVNKLDKNPIFYHVLSSLDAIADIQKYFSRDMINFKEKASKAFVEGISEINKSFKIFYDLYYNFSNEKALNINKRRDDIKFYINENLKKFNCAELAILKYYSFALELLWDLTLARMSIEFEK